MLQRLTGEELAQGKLKDGGLIDTEFLRYWVFGEFTILALFIFSVSVGRVRRSLITSCTVSHKGRILSEIYCMELSGRKDRCKESWEKLLNAQDEKSCIN